MQCHSTDGTTIVGPTFKDLFGSQVPITGQGNVLADENYIRESVLYPQAKVHQGFNPVMPSFLGQLNDNDIYAIICYFKSISVNFKGDLAPFKVIRPGGIMGTPGTAATQPTATGAGSATRPAPGGAGGGK